MKRSEHIQSLSHDHYQGLHVARRLKAGLDAGAPLAQMIDYVSEVWDTHLVNHFHLEETVLIEPLERSGGSELAKQMLDEHQALRQLLATMRAGSADRETVDTFGENLRAHIRFEEREVFPHLEDRLAESDLAEVGEQLRAIHSVTDADWPVPAWE